MERRHQVLRILALTVAFIPCVIFFSLHPQLTGGPTNSRLQMNIDFSRGWTTLDGTPVDLSNLNSIEGFAEHGTTIMNYFPRQVESGVELNFLSKNITFHVAYDDKYIYFYDSDPDMFGKPYGSHFTYVPMSSTDANKTVTFNIKPVYPDSTSQILDMRISGTMPYVDRYVQSHALAFAASLFVAFIGLAVIVLRISLRDRQQGNLDLLSLGSLCILLGIWSACETLVPQMVTDLSGPLRALDYMSLLFVPLPILCFASSLIHTRKRALFTRIALIACACAVACTVIPAAVFSYDMHQLLFVLHAHLALCAVLIVVQFVLSFIENGHSLKRSIRHANRPLSIAFVAFVICAVIDFALYTGSGRSASDPAFHMRLALFCFSIVLAAEAFRTSISYIKRVDQADMMEAIAYTDALTDIGNRTAWQMMSKEAEEILRSGQVPDALVCQFDVNFLKRVNDTLGHEAGDNLIKRAADTVNRSFGTEGICFRTGGDEFTSVLVGINLDERLEQCLQLFTTSIEEQNSSGEGDMPLSMALGYARASETKNKTIKAAQKLADKRMYENKCAMKAMRLD